MSNMLDVHFLELPQVNSPLPRLVSDLDIDQSDNLNVLRLLFDEISHGVLVVSPEGRLIHSNRAAQSDMANRSVLYVQQDELLALSPIDAKLLYAALAKASMGVRSLVRLSGSGVTLMLSAVPLQFRPGQTCQQIALFFERAAICDSGMFVFFARSHKLTRTEEQVLTYLCRGMSTPDIATELNVAVSTVRSHVRSLCFKTGSRGSRELINRIATLPPVGVMSRLHIH
jgi:DNA-binding CsgD family transcriptional regulator